MQLVNGNDLCRETIPGVSRIFIMMYLQCFIFKSHFQILSLMQNGLFFKVAVYLYRIPETALQNLKNLD